MRHLAGTTVRVADGSYSTKDPFNNEELGTVPEMGLTETKEAINAAAKAFPAWSTTTAKVSYTERFKNIADSNDKFVLSASS